jgi:hypothetical protein
MAGTLRPANYVLRVAGSGLTAYELSVRPKLAVIKADIFEPNDSFDSATRLLFDPPSPFSIFPSRGPGDYDATLHQRLIPGIGFLAVNEDYFALHVPPETNNRISQVSVYKADHPLDVSLYDSSQQLIQSWPNQKLVAIKPPAGAVSYLKVSGSKATRYKIGIGRWVDPAVLPPRGEAGQGLPRMVEKSEVRCRFQHQPLRHRRSGGEGQRQDRLRPDAGGFWVGALGHERSRRSARSS